MPDPEKIIEVCKDCIRRGSTAETGAMSYSFFYDVIELLEGQKQIVRCKDCKWRNTRACFCKSPLDVKGYWFCSEGERKTERNVNDA